MALRPNASSLRVFPSGPTSPWYHLATIPQPQVSHVFLARFRGLVRKLANSTGRHVTSSGMALIDPAIDANLQYIRVRANNPDEMLLKLEAAAAALNPANVSIIDFELFACGASPNFLAMLVAADAGNTIALNPSQVGFVVAGGVGGLDPIPLCSAVAQQVIAASADELNKFVCAGGGAGPHWMAAAIYTPQQG